MERLPLTLSKPLPFARTAAALAHWRHLPRGRRSSPHLPVYFTLLHGCVELGLPLNPGSFTPNFLASVSASHSVLALPAMEPFNTGISGSLPAPTGTSRFSFWPRARVRAGSRFSPPLLG